MKRREEARLMAELVQSSDSSSDSEEERKRKRHRKKGKRSKHGHKKRSVMAVRLSVLCSYCWSIPTFYTGARSGGKGFRIHLTLRVREERRGCG